MAKEELEDLKVEYEVDGNPIKLTMSIVKNYIVGSPNVEITIQEFKFFTELCKTRKLNPFLREAYLIKYSNSDPAKLVVGKDAILKRAVKNPQYDGREQGIIVLLDNGKVDFRSGTFKLKNEELVGGWARVYRKDISHPTEITVSFDEVAQKKGDGQLNSNWATKGATMVEKVALVRALRETFVEDLGGMIDEDEAWKDEIKNTQVDVSKKESLLKTYASLRSELTTRGYDFRSNENDEFIRLQADVKTQDAQSLDDEAMERLCDVYENIIKELDKLCN